MGRGKTGHSEVGDAMGSGEERWAWHGADVGMNGMGFHGVREVGRGMDLLAAVVGGSCDWARPQPDDEIMSPSGDRWSSLRLNEA